MDQVECHNSEPYRASQDSNLMSTAAISHQYNFSGTLDIAIVNKEHAETGMSPAACSWELRLKIRHDNQAIVEMLLTNVQSEYPVIVLSQIYELLLVTWVSCPWHCLHRCRYLTLRGALFT